MYGDKNIEVEVDDYEIDDTIAEIESKDGKVYITDTKKFRNITGGYLCFGKEKFMVKCLMVLLVAMLLFILFGTLCCIRISSRYEKE